MIIVKDKGYRGEILYVSSSDKKKYWVIYESIGSKIGDYSFSINDRLQKSLISGSIEAFVFGKKDRMFKGIFRIDPQSWNVDKKPATFRIKTGEIIELYWYSTNQLKRVDVEEVRERQDNIINHLGFDKIVEKYLNKEPCADLGLAK